MSAQEEAVFGARSPRRPVWRPEARPERQELHAEAVWAPGPF